MMESEFNHGELDAARTMIQALRLPHAPVATVPNPMLHKHYSYLRAVATSEAEIKQTFDGTIPDDLLFEEHTPQIRAFHEAFELCDTAPATTTSSSSASKKAKIEKVGPPQTPDDWLKLWQASVPLE